MKFKLFTALLLTSSFGLAQQAPAAPRQDLAALKTVVEQYLKTQSAGLPGAASIEVGAIDPRMSLAACPDPQAFQQPGARAWGKTTVGVRCTAPSAWTVYIQAKVSVQGEYVAAAVPLAQGQPIQQSQLVLMKGDLASMPNGVVTDMEQAVGRSSTISLPSGAPLRLDALRSKPVVQQGQLVRVVSSGAGFKVSAEARAIGNAAEGQVVQVRTPAGAIISGVAQAGGLVEVVF
ncbi:MAG: Flagella basal body P-ring formation protein FlgA [Massilia sp.]|nr:Flagella basal body P-ring formation protein FlgA [Massilia sp.]